MFRPEKESPWAQSQEWLIDIWLEAGRGIFASEEEKAKLKLQFETKNPGGFCWSIDILHAISRYCDAIQPGQSAQFMDRLRYFNSIAGKPNQRADLIEKINAVKRKRIEERSTLQKNPGNTKINSESASSQFNIVADLEAFFHVLDVLQLDNKKVFFDPKLSPQERYNKLIQWISPVLLDAQGGVRIDSTPSNVGKPGFWVQGLMILKKYFDQFPQLIFPMNFFDVRHAIEIEYDATQQIWRVLNLNTLPVLETNDIYDVVKYFFSGFAMSRKWDVDSDLVLSFNLLRLGNQAHLFKILKERLAQDEDWQDWRRVTLVKANTIDFNGNTWLCHAVRVGDLDVIPKLLVLSRHDHVSSIGAPPDIADVYNVPLFYREAIKVAFSKNPPRGAYFSADDVEEIEQFLQNNIRKILKAKRSCDWLCVMDLPLEIIKRIPSWNNVFEKIFLWCLFPDDSASSASSTSSTVISLDQKAQSQKEQAERETRLLDIFKALASFQDGAFLSDPQYGLNLKLHSFSDFFQNLDNQGEFLKVIDEAKRLNKLSKHNVLKMGVQELLGTLKDTMLGEVDKWKILITWLSVKNEISASALSGSLHQNSPYFNFVESWAYVSEKQNGNKNNPLRCEFFDALKKQLQEAQDKTEILEFIKGYKPLDASLLKIQTLIDQYKNQKNLPDLPWIPESVREDTRKNLALGLEVDLNDFYTALEKPTTIKGFKDVIESLAAFIVEAAEKAKKLHQAGSVASFFKIETESQFSKKLMEIHDDLLGKPKEEKNQAGFSSKPDI